MRTVIKNIIIAAQAGLLLLACNPMSDVYQKLDEAREPYREDIAYTLTEADYTAASNAALALAQNAADSAAAKRIKSEQAFNPTFGPENLVPAQLSATFKALNKKSTANVTYNMNSENLGHLSSMLDSLKKYSYEADYSAVGGAVATAGYFVPSMPAAEHIPALLDKAYTQAIKGQYALVTYKQSDVEPVGGSGVKIIFSEDFEAYAKDDSVGKQGNWIAYIPDTAPAGKHTYWRIYNRDANNYPQFSANNYGGTVESWMITPKIDIPAGAKPQFSFDLKIGYYNSTCLRVLLSTNFDGTNAAAATWTDITSSFTLPTEPTGGYGAALENAGSHDLAAYAGKSVYFAFAYKGDSESDPKATTTYQIDNVVVKEGKDVPAYNDVYHYDGSKWASASKVVAVQPSEYKQMGLSSLNADKAKLFVPQVLASRYPFAMEGDTAIAVYKGDDKGTLEATKWTMADGQWSMSSSIEQRTMQFIHNGSVWVFDPAVDYVMVKDDYQLMVDYIGNHAELGKFYDQQYKNAEYYYGFSSRYSNLSFRLSYRNPFFSKEYTQPAELDSELSAISSTEDKVALLWKRSEEGVRVFLEQRFPNAVPQVSGIDVHYHVTVTIYSPDGLSASTADNQLHRYSYRCTGSNPATFEFVERKQVE